MEKQVCISCCATKDFEEFSGFKTYNRCREAKRKCYGKNKNEYNQARREERAKGSQLCEECGCSFPLCVTSELGSKCIDERLFKEIR